jgi:hypothetical protein
MNVPKPRFYVRNRRGQLRIVICLSLKEAQRLGWLLSRAVVAALLFRFGNPSNPPQRINPKTS